MAIMMYCTAVMLVLLEEDVLSNCGRIPQFFASLLFNSDTYFFQLRLAVENYILLLDCKIELI